MMQGLLFGPARLDTRYQDLRPRELALFAVFLLSLVLLGAIGPEWPDVGPLAKRHPVVMEMMRWQK
jgi:hypothetical protein